MGWNLGRCAVSDAADAAISHRPWKCRRKALDRKVENDFNYRMAKKKKKVADNGVSIAFFHGKKGKKKVIVFFFLNIGRRLLKFASLRGATSVDGILLAWQARPSKAWAMPSPSVPKRKMVKPVGASWPLHPRCVIYNDVGLQQKGKFSR